jgi:hypothetical protein
VSGSRRTIASFGSERGLVGKLVLLSLLAAVLVALLAIDTGSILLARLRASEVAHDAAFAAAEAYAGTGRERAAKLAALETIAASGQEVRLERIRVRRERVTIVLGSEPRTLLLGRIGAFAGLTEVRVTDSSTAPGP